MYQPRIDQAKRDMQKVLDGFTDDLKILRTGRATPSLVEDITISLYGTPTPLMHAATITSPDPKMVVIAPWDKSLLGEIENAIKISDLGVNPTNDGTVVRISIPPMTEDRRKELIKKLHQIAEETKVALRTMRRDVWAAIQAMEQDGKISEDDLYAAEKSLNQLIEDMNGAIDSKVEAKEKEIMTI